MSLCAEDMILHTENPKDSTKKLLELIHEFNKVAGHKINIQKSIAFLLVAVNIWKLKLKTTYKYYLQLLQRKYLGIHLKICTGYIC